VSNAIDSGDESVVSFESNEFDGLVKESPTESVPNAIGSVDDSAVNFNAGGVDELINDVSPT